MVRDDFLSLLQTIILDEIPSASPSNLMNICHKLQIESGGYRVYIPTYDLRAKRNSEIYSDVKHRGLSKTYVASKYNLTVRQINKILACRS